MQLRTGTSSLQLGPILVIDDDEIALQAISDLLQRAGYEVHPLASPIGATQVIANEGISAAVIDLNMPVMRGDRFIALVRSWDRIRDLPIVLVSGESSEAIHDAARRLPGVAVVTKRQMSELLVPTLRQALSGPEGKQNAAPPPGVAAASGQAVRVRQETPHAGVARALPRLARNALTVWQSFASGAGQAGGSAAVALSTLETETILFGLHNTAELLALARQLVEACGSARAVPGEADVVVTELLSQLANGTNDKNRSFDRSLALTLLRTRLERVRHVPS